MTGSAALIPAYLAWQDRNIPSILTIHNLAYQGVFPKHTLGCIGAPESAFHIDGVEFYNKVSFLKAGLVYSTHLTTVSATYAREIVDAEVRLRPRRRAGQARPRQRADRHPQRHRRDLGPELAASELANQFGPESGRANGPTSDHVRKEFGLALSRGPLFGLVARLVHQKGVDLVLSAAETIVAAGGQIVVMGQGEPQFERALQEAQQRQPQSIAVALRFKNDAARPDLRRQRLHA